MSFWDLLKIEFMKVRRSKIVPLIFVAPLLVVISGVASLSNYLHRNIPMRGLPCSFKVRLSTLTICSRLA